MKMKRLRPPSRAGSIAAALAVVSLTGLVLMSTCSPPVPTLDRIKTLGMLKVATVNSPTTYYIGVSGPTGFEYDLARSFADHLGVELQMLVLESPTAVLNAVSSGRAHLGAAALAGDLSFPGIRYSRALRQTQAQLVYRQGSPKPKSVAELKGRLVFPAGSGASVDIKTQLAQNTELRWNESAEEDAEELLNRVALGKLDYTIASSGLVAITQRYHPELRAAFAAGPSHDLAWALPSNDESLRVAATDFLQKLGAKQLATLNERHFGHISQINVWNAASLATHVKNRLPTYRKDFEKAGTATDLDWRLIAAVGYQESHWDPSAVSPTMVRGIMQITTATADFLKVDRLNPSQSIAGAARYLVYLKSQLPPEIPEPDRTWMTLASYNMGVGHLLDARELVRKQKGDPNRWLDVRNVLPQLTQYKWFSQTKYGYARGLEAMTYVANIRSYYDMLVWITEGKKGSKPPEPEVIELPPLPDKNKQPLNIESPVL
ncbi:MAG: membrane-bound lytic murein transglycosylase MltF [Pseudomonadota bacterium]